MALCDPFHNEEVFLLPNNIRFYKFFFLCIMVFTIPKELTLYVRECEWNLPLIFFVGELHHCPWLLWESLTAGSKQQVAEGEPGQTGSLGETVSGSPGERPNIAFSHQWNETHAPWRRIWWKPILEVMLKELRQDSDLRKADFECMLTFDQSYRRHLAPVGHAGEWMKTFL